MRMQGRRKTVDFHTSIPERCLRVVHRNSSICSGKAFTFRQMHVVVVDLHDQMKDQLRIVFRTCSGRACQDPQISSVGAFRDETN